MPDSTPARAVKVKDVMAGGSTFARYRHIQYGAVSSGFVLKAELAQWFCGSLPGAAGLFLRSRLYPALLGAAGPKCLFGRNMTLRHPGKIRLGQGVMADDNVVLDAKGESNNGITIGSRVFIGRNTIIYCKNGNIAIEDDVSISSNCTIFSSNSLTIGAGTVIGAYSYLLSGGEYDLADPTPFAEQSGMETRGPLTVGRNCWLGARVTVLDAACIGDQSVIGAGAVVTKPVPGRSLAVGVPARVIRQRA